MKHNTIIRWTALRSLILYISSSCTSSEFFHRSGKSLCALDTPSESFHVDSPGCGPPQCAWICSHDVSCTGFNFVNSDMTCDIYFFVPIHYSQISGCAYYSVGENHILNIYVFLLPLEIFEERDLSSAQS